MMHRLQEELNKAQQQKVEAEERADRWEKIKSVRPKSRCCCSCFCKNGRRQTLTKPIIHQNILDQW